MKPDEKLRRYRDTMPESATVVQMTVDDNAMAHIMDVLSKQYSDPELACVREYSTNAWDAHVEAGQKRPIEVTTPTRDKPYLTIKDYGIGLDREAIVNIYSRYGTSTKRETNDQNGMLGLGCKSALAYSDQFTVIGVKNGIRTTVLVGRDEDGGASQTIVDERETTEHNGVTVQIPAKQSNSFKEKAERLFAFWPKGQVLLNGAHVEPIGKGAGSKADPDEGTFWLDDHVLLTKNEYAGRDLIVMGNVPYPLYDDAQPLFEEGRRSYRYSSDGFNAVCFVPIGTVNFAPSREMLMDTKRTKDALDKLRAHIKAKRDEAVIKQVAEAKTAKEAQDTLRTGQRLGFKGTAQWQGRDVLLSLSREKPDGAGTYSDPMDWDVEVALKHSYLHVGWTTYSKKSGERSRTLVLEKEFRVFTGFDGKIMTNVKRAKLELWWAANGPKSKFNPDQVEPMPPLLMVEKLTDDEAFWLNGRHIHDWADVDAIKLPTNTAADGTTKRLSGSYDLYEFGDYREGIPAAKINQSKPVYWHHGNRWTAGNHSAFRSGAIDAKGCTVVCLSKNRIDKFCRDFPGAIKLDDAARKAAERWVKQANKDTVAAYAVGRHVDVGLLRRLDEADVKDPDLVKVIRQAKRDVRAFTAEVQKWSRWVAVPDDAKAVKFAAQVTAKYPLLSALRNVTNKEHVVLYLNAAYKAEKGV
jgi:hypothetical protein